MSLHHRFDGAEPAPTLVLANSLATTLELWDGNVAALASRYRILRYDQRGHGRSPVPPGPYRVEDLAEDVLELLDELGLERVSFCGLSLGGAVGMALALRAPERLERLILCCTSAQFAPAGEVGRASANRPRRRARDARRRHARALVHARIPGSPARGGGAIPRSVPRDPSGGLCSVLRGTRGLGLSAGRSPRSPSRRSSIAAADDPSTPPEHLEAIAAAIPGTAAHRGARRRPPRQRRATRGVRTTRS